MAQKRKSAAGRGGKAPTTRDRAYVAGVISGKSKTRAGLDAGFSFSVADNAKQKIESKPAVQALFREALHKAGVTDGLLANLVREGLGATKVERATAHAPREILIDFSERRAMVSLACELTGRKVAKLEHEIGPSLAELLGESYEDGGGAD